MKKYFLSMLVAVGLISSCSNDDIDVNVVEDIKTTFTYSVETQSVYDKFNATTTLKRRFLSGEYGDYHIGTFTYIYDKDGQLVTSEKSFTKTFGEVSSELTLSDGKYTAITVEMIVDKDNKYESETFEIVGADKLATIEIAFKKDSDGDYLSNSTLWYECIGVGTTEIIVNESQKEIKVTPKPIGIILNTTFTNFDKSGYNIILIHTRNVPVGRYLDPNKSGDARFHYLSYNQGNNQELRNFVYNSNGLENSEGVDVYMIEEGDIECGMGPSIVKDDKIQGWYDCGKRNGFKDGNTYYGGLYYIGGELQSGKDFTGGIFNSESEYNSWFSNAEKQYKPITPTGGFSLVTPYMTWGSKVSTVHSAMSGTTQVEGTSSTAVYNSTTESYYTMYMGMDVATAIQYYFTSSTTGLVESDVFYDSSVYSFETINSELEKKYTFLAKTESGTYGYTTSDYKTMILLMPGSSYSIVGYVDVSYVSGAKTAVFEKTVQAKQAVQRVIPLAMPERKCKISQPFRLDKHCKNNAISRINR